MRPLCPWRLVPLAAAAALAACSGGSPSEGGAVRKNDAPAWQGAGNPYVAEGWKAGDQTSWEQQMRVRVQGQNEYTRGSGG